MSPDTFEKAILPATKLDPVKVRKDFPILDQAINGKPLTYFDNAATTQKPLEVIRAIDTYYREYNSNIHRGIHSLAERATDTFELTRSALKSFLSASSEEEIIFTYGTTDSINLVASSYGSEFLKKGDEVIISAMEHHSNIVPWQMICEKKGAKLKIIPVSDDGEILVDAFRGLLSDKTKIVSIVHISNSLGTINPIKTIIDEAHKYGAMVLIDGAQSAAHITIDVQSLDCDFFAFSSHKMFGPTGVGVLYGKKNLLESMPPYRGGGEMINEVTFEKTTYNHLPFKFEAGTPNIADVIGLKSAIDYINSISKKEIYNHEQGLIAYAHKQLKQIEGLRIFGNARHKSGIVSFNIDQVHPFDIGVFLDASGIAIRTGHHCTQPLMRRLGVEGTARASFSIYNTYEEIDTMANQLKKIVKLKRK